MPLREVAAVAPQGQREEERPTEAVRHCDQTWLIQASSELLFELLGAFLHG